MRGEKSFKGHLGGHLGKSRYDGILEVLLRLYYFGYVEEYPYS